MLETILYHKQKYHFFKKIQGLHNLVFYIARSIYINIYLYIFVYINYVVTTNAWMKINIC